MKKLKSTKIQKTVMNVMTENMDQVIKNLTANNNVLEIKYEPEYSYTLCRNRVTTEKIGYKVVVKYKE